MNFNDVLSTRHSEYDLSKEVRINDVAIESLVQDVLTYTPSAFNSQSQRILLLMKKEHDDFWMYLIEKMKDIVPAENYQTTKDKLLKFKNAYGTVMFYEDMQVVENLQDKYPLYKEQFSRWSIEQNGMLQSNVWLALKANDLGASLQHYNELVDDYLKETYHLPIQWELRAQMPFGKIVNKSNAKSRVELSKRFILKK